MEFKQPAKPKGELDFKVKVSSRTSRVLIPRITDNYNSCTFITSNLGQQPRMNFNQSSKAILVNAHSMQQILGQPHLNSHTLSQNINTSYVTKIEGLHHDSIIGKYYIIFMNTVFIKNNKFMKSELFSIW